MTPRILTGCAVLPPAKKTSGRKTASAAKTADATKAKRKTAGRFATINAFVDCGMAGLRPVEQVVWFVLWRNTKSNGLAYASQAQMSKQIGTSERTVRRSVERLARLGLLRVVHRGGLSKGCSVYRVVPLPPAGVLTC